MKTSDVVAHSNYSAALVKTYIMHATDSNPMSVISNMNNAIRTAAKANITINDMPELGKLIEEHKTAWITSLLHAIKDPEGTSLAKLQVKNLLKVGIRWPELGIMNKSINAIQQPEELNESPLLESLAINVNKAIESTDIWQMGFYLRISRIQFNDDYSQFIPVLNRNKYQIINGLLTEIKGRQWDNWDNITRLINTFIHTGVNWPELEIMKRSVSTLKEGFDQQPGRVTIERFIEDDSHDLFQMAWLKQHIEQMKKAFAYVKTNPKANVFPLNTIGMFTRAVHLGKLTNEDIIPELESVKVQIIEYMLASVKLEHKVSWDLVHSVRELRSLGITWPELDIIEKSYNADRKKLKEDFNDEFDNPSDDVYIGWFVQEMIAGKPYAAYECMNKLIQLNIDKVEIAKVLNTPRNLEFLTKYVIYRLWNRTDLMHETVEFLATLPMGILDNVKAKINNEKDKLIKYMLEDIRDGYYTGADGTIKVFKYLKLQWPELDIIQKSIKANTSKEIAENNEDFDDLYHIDINIKQILLVILADKGYDYIDRQNIIVIATRSDRLPELCKQYKPDLLEKLEENICSSESYNVNNGLSRMYSLAAIGCNWSELKMLVTKYKKHIIRQLLIDIKEGADDYYIKMLEPFKLNWPELDIISKSLAANNASQPDQIDETIIVQNRSQAEHLAKQTMNTLINSVKSDSIHAVRHAISTMITAKVPRDIIKTAFEENKNWALYDIKGSITREFSTNHNIMSLVFEALVKLEWVGIDWPDVRKYINDRKGSIIKYLLKIIREGDAYDMGEVETCISYLIGLKYNWPELDIIEKSLNASNPASLTESARDPQSIMKYLNELLDSNFDISTDVGECFKQLASSNVKLPNELKAKLIKDKDTVLDALRVIAADQLIDRLLDIFTWLKVNGLDRKELTLEHFKRIIIRTLLVSARHMADTHTLMTLKQLSDLRIHWPELEAIRKSVEATVAHKIDQARRAEINEGTTPIGTRYRFSGVAHNANK